MAVSLTELANDEATDKGTRGPSARRGHNYTDIYECYLASLRNKPLTLLEIGLGVKGPVPNNVWLGGRNTEGGASMRMWYRYLPNARIFGIDINPAEFLDNERICTGVVDQGDPSQLRSFLREHDIEAVDVIIDDGSHLPHHQQISLSTLFPVLSSGGLYFIEDLMANGLGDARSGPNGCDVLNTRTVLRQFSETGVFPEPNAFADGPGLAHEVSTISFHCPGIMTNQLAMKPVSRAKLAAKILRGERGIPFDVQYRAPGREKLGVLTKV
jgi:hypothetical protein